MVRAQDIHNTVHWTHTHAPRDHIYITHSGYFCYATRLQSVNDRTGPRSGPQAFSGIARATIQPSDSVSDAAKSQRGWTLQAAGVVARRRAVD